MKIKWLNRRMSQLGPYLTLCTTKAQYLQALKDCDVEQPDAWVSDRAGATVHHLHNLKGEAVCVVCIREHPDSSAVEIAGLLVHEAVHVVQSYFSDLGEREPASEQHAYAVQSVAQELLQAYADRLK